MKSKIEEAKDKLKLTGTIKNINVVEYLSNGLTEEYNQIVNPFDLPDKKEEEEPHKYPTTPCRMEIIDAGNFKARNLQRVRRRSPFPTREMKKAYEELEERLGISSSNFTIYFDSPYYPVHIKETKKTKDE